MTQQKTSLLSDTKRLVEKANEFGERLANDGIKAHQLRRIYDTVQSIHSASGEKGQLSADQKARLIFLKPLLAYLASKKDNLKALQTDLSSLIDEIGDDYKKLDRFYRFLQSILAYHKYYEQIKQRKEGEKDD